MDPHYIKSWNFRTVYVIFIRFVRIYPEQLYIIEMFKGEFPLWLTMCDQKPHEGCDLKLISQFYELLNNNTS